MQRSGFPKDLKPEKLPDYTFDDVDTSSGKDFHHDKSAVPVNVGGGELRGRSQGEHVKTAADEDKSTPVGAGFVWWKTRL